MISFRFEDGCCLFQNGTCISVPFETVQAQWLVPFHGLLKKIRGQISISKILVKLFHFCKVAAFKS